MPYKSSDKRREYMRKWAHAKYHATPELRKQRAAYTKRWRDNNQDKIHAWPSRQPRERLEQGYVDKYGMTMAQIEAMAESQGWKCAICLNPVSKREDVIRTSKETMMRFNFVVDHCHDTGTVRGVLCRNCNLGIGYLRDNAYLCRAASEYLDKCQRK